MNGDDDLWDQYADALIECEIDGQPRYLRGPNCDELPDRGPIFVLTAYNPGGVARDEARNEAAQVRLEHDLAAIGLTVWPAVGRSRDASWSEPGVAVAGLGRDRACAYGTRYGQLAVFELTADDVHVVRCHDAQTVRTRPRHT
ncbi:MAG TPA: DUF3293 domain-containing protein [Acidimicrobiia bacterium]|nr:DUF3293 domain-containing protein [Acidimicrobiia bacterium]